MSDESAENACAPSEIEIEHTIKVLEYLAEEKKRVNESEGLMTVARLIGKFNDDKVDRKKKKAEEKRRKLERRREERELLEKTGIREGRRQLKSRLQNMYDLPPKELGWDSASPSTTVRITDGKEEEEEEEKEEEKEEKGKEREGNEKIILGRDRTCYVCKVKYRELHDFYDLMCPSCAAFNFEKRLQSGDLRGRVALVTGGRLKIGHEVVLKLLRAGCTVHMTSRFPKDAACRFATLEDFGSWRERLHIYGLDFRSVPALELFLEFLNRTLSRLDIIINNAAITIRRPPAFYRHLLANEVLKEQELPKEGACLLTQHGEFAGDAHAAPLLRVTAGPGGAALPVLSRETLRGVGWSSALSQVPMEALDVVHDREELFRPGEYDEYEQQVDRREVNLWRTPIEDMSTVALVEQHTVNAIAPFLIVSRLRHLMARTRPPEDPQQLRYVINVGAREGQMYRKGKTKYGVAGNAAKAALNMMTRTIAQDMLDTDRIVCCVPDTGWINEESPFDIAQGHFAQGFSCPLDDVDAAARILDPVFMGVNHGSTEANGKFLRNYKPDYW